ncbi:DMT family transporter [Clostridium cylindrosporum]|uniref:Integral membrane protein n=1 Tax=Clostridium cylindrosporum DSM 605 TaxID=1121307 RepID=A0A0J8DBT5_CLOCY|nr:DMT family transporter [Clostridium cylindrosporum]KMT21753.1 integral membrane protein [Clostridium cylindrosporum DSM 605]
MNNYKGILYAIMSSAAFGLSPIFGKLSYASGSNPTSILLFRFLIAGVVLLAYLIYKKIDIRITKQQFIVLLLIGGVGYTVTTETLFMSYVTLGAGLGTTLHFIYPALVCLISIFVFKERVSRVKLISLLLAGIGLYSLIAFENQKLDIIGVILALTSGVTYSVSIIALGFKTITSIDNRIATMYVSFGAFIGMLLYGVFSDTIVLKFNAGIVFSYIGIALVSTILAIIFFLKAIETIGPTSTSILATLEPIISIILGIIIFGENLSFSLVIGSAFIVISTIILAKEK